MDTLLELFSMINWDAASSIISAISMIVLVFTVIEMKNQRINSYKPDIYFDPKQYRLIKGDWPGFRLNPNSSNNSPDIIFRNVGNGIAKDVKITMFYDVIGMKRDISIECADYFKNSDFDVNDMGVT